MQLSLILVCDTVKMCGSSSGHLTYKPHTQNELLPVLVSGVYRHLLSPRVPL